MGHEAEPAVIQLAQERAVVRDQAALQQLGVGLAGRVGQLDRGLGVRSRRGLAQRDAVDAATALDQVERVDRHDLAAGPGGGERLAAALSVASPKLGMITAPLAR